MFRRTDVPLRSAWRRAAAGTPDDFKKLIADDTAKWAAMIKFAGIKPE